MGLHELRARLCSTTLTLTKCRTRIKRLAADLRQLTMEREDSRKAQEWPARPGLRGAFGGLFGGASGRKVLRSGIAADALQEKMDKVEQQLTAVTRVRASAIPWVAHSPWLPTSSTRNPFMCTWTSQCIRIWASGCST